MTLWLFRPVECFRQPYSRSFVAPRCSTAYCLYAVGIFGLIVLPLFFAFVSDNVWAKESFYRERPHVNFTHDLLFTLGGENAADSVGWSTREDLTPLLPTVVHPAVRLSTHDKDFDGVPDVLRFRMQVPTGDIQRSFRHLQLLLVCNYELREKVRERTVGLVVLDAGTALPATGLWARGRLVFKQSFPLRVLSEARQVYADNPLSVNWASNWAATGTPVTTRSLLERYAMRNDTLQLELSVPPVWDYSPRDSFEVDVTIDVPQQLVHYIPGSLEVLKFAWMQVLSFLVPVALVVRCVQACAYEHQIVETVVVPQVLPKGAGA